MKKQADFENIKNHPVYEKFIKEIQTEHDMVLERKRMVEEIASIRRQAEKLLPELRTKADEAKKQVLNAGQSLRDAEKRYSDLQSEAMGEALSFNQKISKIENILIDTASPEISRLQSRLRRT